MKSIYSSIFLNYEKIDTNKYKISDKKKYNIVTKLEEDVLSDTMDKTI